MKRSPLKTILILLVNYIVFAGTVVASLFYKPTINSYWIFILWGLGLTAAYSIVVFGLNIFVNKDLFIIPKTIIKRKKEAKK